MARWSASFKVSMPGTLSVKMLWSASSSANTMRLWATGQLAARACASRPTVRAMALGILLPPNTAGSKQFADQIHDEQTVGRLGRHGAPKPCRS